MGTRVKISRHALPALVLLLLAGAAVALLATAAPRSEFARSTRPPARCRAESRTAAAPRSGALGAEDRTEALAAAPSVRVGEGIKPGLDGAAEYRDARSDRRVLAEPGNSHTKAAEAAPEQPETNEESDVPPECGPMQACDDGAPQNTRVETQSSSLSWLADHQHPDGGWCPATFAACSSRAHAKRTGNVLPGALADDCGHTQERVQATAMVLLAYAERGNDHKEGDFKECVRRGLLFLRAQQDTESGLFRTESASPVRCQAWATWALCLIYGLSGDCLLKEPAQKAVRYLEACRTPGAGWGRQPCDRQPDVISTCVASLALQAAAMSGLETTEAAVKNELESFLWALHVPSTGQCWYSQSSALVLDDSGNAVRSDLPLCETAWWVTMLRVTQGEICTHAGARRHLRALMKNPVGWGDGAGPGNEFFLYLNTDLAYCVSAKAYDRRCDAQLPRLLDAQRGYTTGDVARGYTSETLDEFGSWDVMGPWFAGTGRVGSTAMTNLFLGVVHRCWYRRLEPVKTVDLIDEPDEDPPK